MTQFANFSILILICLVALISQGADSPRPDFRGYIDYIEQINQFTPVEGAGSHGSFGTKVGLGLQITPRAPEIAPESRYLYLNSKSEDQTHNSAPKLGATRGLSIPIDFGLSFGAIDDTNVQQWAAYVQWTAFQLFGYPALGARYAIAKLSGLEFAELTTHSGELIISYGFLRYFNAFTSIKRNFNGAVIHEANEDIYFNDVVNTTSVGLEITIIPPFTSLALVHEKSPDKLPILTAKLGYLL